MHETVKFTLSPQAKHDIYTLPPLMRLLKFGIFLALGGITLIKFIRVNRLGIDFYYLLSLLYQFRKSNEV